MCSLFLVKVDLKTPGYVVSGVERVRACVAVGSKAMWWCGRLGAGPRDAAAPRRIAGPARAGLARRLGARLAARRHRQAPPRAAGRPLRRLVHALLHHGLLG